MIDLNFLDVVLDSVFVLNENKKVVYCNEAGEFSGRGVGMDAVRFEVLELGGTIEAFSTLGKATCLKIKIPLCKAIEQIWQEKLAAVLGVSSYIVKPFSVDTLK